MRTSIAARTTSASSHRPTPAALEMISRRDSSAARPGSWNACRPASEPNPVLML
jgi:hypothetical protein